MGKRQAVKTMPLLVRLLIPLMVVMIVQSALFCGTIIYGGTIQELTQNAYDILNERVINRINYLQNEMLQRWANIDESVMRVNDTVEQYLGQQNKGYQDIVVNSDLATGILEELTDEMLYILRKNSVTGAFLLLSGQDTTCDPETNRSYSGLCLRNMDPEYSTRDNSDLLLERCPTKISKSIGISMDSWWEPQFNFTKDSYSGFYDKPFLAAMNNPGLGWKNLGYWSLPYTLSGEDAEVISYSVPLIRNGRVYGVMGIELSVDYLRKQLPYSEVNGEKAGAYLIGVDASGENTFQAAVSSGPAYRQLFGGSDSICLAEQTGSADNFYVTSSDQEYQPAIASVQYFEMYNRNTPFEQERWALIGLVRESDLLLTVHQVRTLVMIALAVSLTIGLISLCAVGCLIVRPIGSLVNQLKVSDPRRPVDLDKTNITEFNELAGAFEQLSAKVADSASKLSQIIELANVEIGAFEYHSGQQDISYSGALVKMLGLLPNACGTISAQEFRLKIEEMEQNLEEASEDHNVRVYSVQENGYQRWLRLKLVRSEKRLLGVFTDITQEMVEKRKIEYERDYDILTNLLNRRAFHSIINKKFEKPEQLKVAALIMLDLDNLKYLNDTYGHDFGDMYIQSAAGALSRMGDAHSVIARMSGDEFLVFLFGYNEKNTLRRRIEEIRDSLRETTLSLPDGETFRVRASAGVAWYPDDTKDSEELIHFADFAMYRVKNTTKGEFNEFDSSIYHRESYLLHSREDLNKLIDGELIDYHFQPIVSVQDGSVFGYEALMRSQLSSLKSPLEILSLARSQSKLYQIERLTWFLAMKAYVKNREAMGDCKIFINSIPNQELSPEDMIHFEEQFLEYLPNLVMELTEEERIDENSMIRKQQFIRHWNGQLALDDFGTGYNGESVLLNIKPDYVKLDMSLVRNIDTDVSRQKLMKNLVSYAKMNQITVLAEGIETKEEMETVIRIGVDLMQGYYLGIPSITPKPIEPTVQAEIATFSCSQRQTAQSKKMEGSLQ